ncbi:MAG: hypothetical protein HY663_01010, partial [Chloroflexi bacterium]|nr:hypothetical protein [Chloroflexota bacterium]
LAVMRTGRADWITNIESEDAQGLIKSRAELQYKRFLPGGRGINLRIEKKELPFDDVKVRQALMLATDFEAFKNDLYRGDAEIYIWPIAPTFLNMYVAVKDWPPQVQALYKYNPEKAKQLLAEAGYPKGFKTKLMVENISTQMDPAAAMKAMWAKVGVDIELQPRERTTYLSMQTARSWEEMTINDTTFGTNPTGNYGFRSVRGATLGWSDPVIEKAFQDMQGHMFLDMPKADEIFRNALPFILEQAYVIPFPTPYTYTLWQPWLKNHYGETALNLWLPYAWVDQDLKEKMTGRR